MHNEVIQGDCLKIMPLIPSGSVDLILCDLPYGTTRSKWDIIIPFEPLWTEYKRVIKSNGAIVLFAKAPFDKMLWSSNPTMYRYEWIWVKNKATGHLNAEHMPLQAHENILVFYKSPPTYNPQMSNGHRPMNYAKGNHKSTVYGDGISVVNKAGTTERHPQTVLHFPVVNNDDPDRFHPNQKPIELLQFLIRTYTNECETVLDNCSGSGSTAEACISINRNFICIERDGDFVRKSRRRLRFVQQALF